MPAGYDAKFVHNLPRFPQPPKSTLRVGTDITSLLRHRSILYKAARVSRVGPGLGQFEPDTLNPLSKLFAKRFHRWELPFLVYRLRRYANRWDKFIPVGSTKGETVGKTHELELAALTRWCAGRWAMKEAVIKALWPRPVFHSDIVVLPEKAVELLATAPEYALRSQSLIPRMKLSEEALGGKPIVLVRPAVSTITMSAVVAIRRGITLNTREREYRQVFRRAHSHISTWQMLDGSISHDGNFAVASVVAEPQHYEAQPTLVDDGTADFLQHEPKLTDRGYIVYRIVPSRFAPEEDKEKTNWPEDDQVEVDGIDEAAVEEKFDQIVGKEQSKPFASYKKFGRHPKYLSLKGFEAAPRHRVLDESTQSEEVEQPPEAEQPPPDIDAAEQYYLRIKQSLGEDEFLGPVYERLVKRAEQELAEGGISQEEPLKEALRRKGEGTASKPEEQPQAEQTPPVRDRSDQYPLDIKQRLSKDEFLGPAYDKLMRDEEAELGGPGLSTEQPLEAALRRKEQEQGSIWEKLLEDEDEETSKGAQFASREAQALMGEEPPKDDYEAFLRDERRIAEESFAFLDEESLERDDVDYPEAEPHFSGEGLPLGQDEHFPSDADKLSAEELTLENERRRLDSAFHKASAQPTTTTEGEEHHSPGESQRRRPSEVKHFPSEGEQGVEDETDERK